MAKVRIGENKYVDLDNETDVKSLNVMMKKMCVLSHVSFLAWGAIGIFGIVKAVKHHNLYGISHGIKIFTEEILENRKDK